MLDSLAEESLIAYRFHTSEQGIVEIGLIWSDENDIPERLTNRIKATID